MNNCDHLTCPDCGAWLPHQPVPRKRKIWVNVYPGFADAYATREVADSEALRHGADRLARVCIEVEEGRFDE